MPKLLMLRSREARAQSRVIIKPPSPLLSVLVACRLNTAVTCGAVCWAPKAAAASITTGIRWRWDQLDQTFASCGIPKVETGSTAAEAGMNALDRAKNMVEQATFRISPTLTEPKVVKTYPASTHAHTVEFVLKEEARLNSLFQSLERGFRTGQGRIWRE